MARPAWRSTMRRQLERAANSLISTSGLPRPYWVHHLFSGSLIAARPRGLAHCGSSGVAAFLGPFLSAPYWAKAGWAETMDAMATTTAETTVNLRMLLPQGDKADPFAEP